MVKRFAVILSGGRRSEESRRCEPAFKAIAWRHAGNTRRAHLDHADLCRISPIAIESGSREYRFFLLRLDREDARFARVLRHERKCIIQRQPRDAEFS